MHIIKFFSLVETYAKHLSPKTQRTHRDNRRGMVMKRRQKVPPKKPGAVLQDSSVQSQSKTNQGAKRLSSSDGKSEGPDPKRSKITWP